jgi:hypothetical protein
MAGSELHVQARIWRRRDDLLAGLVMEGEAPQRRPGGRAAMDALHRAVLARGLPLTTDVQRMDLRPVPGWRLEIEPRGALTLRWPRFRPLFQDAPLDLPPGWMRLVTAREVVVVFVGYGLGLHGSIDPDHGQATVPLEQVAEVGALAAGAVRASVSTVPTGRPVSSRFPVRAELGALAHHGDGGVGTAAGQPAGARHIGRTTEV